MPIYEYECLECGIHFEQLQRFGDPQPGICPNGHKRVHRVFSQPAIIFKGSGFYVTDHGRNGRRKPSRKTRQNEDAGSATIPSAKEETTSQ